MSAFTLKIIAICSMLLDHANSFLLLQNIFTEGLGLPFETANTVFMFITPLGRLAFPIFAFFISEGCKHSKNPQQYVARLLVFALLSELPFQWMHGNFSLLLKTSNVLFTLALGAVACLVCKKIKDNGHRFLALLPPLGFVVAGELARTDYGSLGVLLVFSAYLFPRRFPRLLAGEKNLTVTYKSGAFSKCLIGVDEMVNGVWTVAGAPIVSRGNTAYITLSAGGRFRVTVSGDNDSSFRTGICNFSIALS